MSREPLAVSRRCARIRAGSRLTVHSSPESGITLIELLVVMAIVGLIMGVAYPNVTSGLDGIRVKTSADRAGAFWSQARQRADRYQQVVQVVVDPEKNELRAASVEEDWSADLPFEQQLRIQQPKARAAYLLYPGAPSPKFEILLAAGEESTAGIRVNVLTGVPEEWAPEPREER